jgi:hypothetical protein
LHFDDVPVKDIAIFLLMNSDGLSHVEILGDCVWRFFCVLPKNPSHSYHLGEFSLSQVWSLALKIRNWVLYHPSSPTFHCWQFSLFYTFFGIQFTDKFGSSFSPRNLFLSWLQQQDLIHEIVEI